MVDGLKKPSVTNITGVIAKPALTGWAVKVTTEWISARWKPGKAYTQKQINIILEDAKSARYRVSKKAMDIGSAVHDWIELYIKARIVGLPIPEMPDYDPVISGVNAFLAWEEHNKVEWVSSERKVYSREHGYVGTVDADAFVNGRRCIIDFKTSSGIYDEYFLQAAAYCIALEEEYGVKFDGLVILRVPKDGGEFEAKTNESAGYKIEELQEVFLSTLKLYLWENKD